MPLSSLDGDNAQCIIRENSRPRQYESIVSTLNAASLLPSDHLDLSGLINAKVFFPTSRDSQALWYGTSTKRGGLSPFPPHSVGFLHYYRPRHAAPLEDSIRFRVTPDNAPSSFQRGHDLLLPSGLPWGIVLPTIARDPQYSTLHDQLLEDNLVRAGRLSRCREVFGTVCVAKSTLFRLKQEFRIHSAGSFRGMLTAVGDDALRSFSCDFNKSVFPHAFRQCQSCHPWAALALAHFEPSTRPQDAGRRVVHLRITKAVDPTSLRIKRYNSFLLQRSEPEPWPYDIDALNTPSAAALRVLWNRSSIRIP
ncbi:hypothetical protein C8R45DRAFT_901845 [Mycena sanguinolenta]|nr:hypothetical protein C8R45DRAFT_901845 [Mycena sanguinolenta]